MFCIFCSCSSKECSAHLTLVLESWRKPQICNRVATPDYSGALALHWKLLRACVALIIIIIISDLISLVFTEFTECGQGLIRKVSQLLFGSVCPELCANLCHHLHKKTAGAKSLTSVPFSQMREERNQPHGSNFCSCPEILQCPVSQSETVQGAGLCCSEFSLSLGCQWNKILFSLGQPCAPSVCVCSGSSGCGQAGSVCWLNGKLPFQTMKAVFLLDWILRHKTLQGWGCESAP